MSSHVLESDLSKLLALPEGLGGDEGFAWQPNEIYRSRHIVAASCEATNPPNADITSFLNDGIQTVEQGSESLTKHFKDEVIQMLIYLYIKHPRAHFFYMLPSILNNSLKQRLKEIVRWAGLMFREQ